MPAPKVVGIYPPDTVTVRLFTSRLSSLLTNQDVAQSLAIDVLGSGVSDLLAADVEYRIHLIAQEAKKFMVQGKRSTLLPEDIEQAMAALNVEVSPITYPKIRNVADILSLSSSRLDRYHRLHSLRYRALERVNNCIIFQTRKLTFRHS